MKIKLTKEEKTIEAAITRGEYSSVGNLSKRKTELRNVARNTLEKQKVITLRVTERNYRRLKAAALREGVPYQTLVSSLIHKHLP